MRIPVFAAMAIAVVFSGGCSIYKDRAAAHYATLMADDRDASGNAALATEKAARLFNKGRLDQAEAALKDALAADVTYAPAHNNLGIIYYETGQYYLAAWEFEYAARLMPDCPDPPNNLGMVYERVGRMEKAIENYTRAHTMQPQNPEFVANLARARLTLNEKDAEAYRLLADLLLCATRPDQAAWAREVLATGKFAQRPPETSCELLVPANSGSVPTVEEIPAGNATPVPHHQPPSTSLSPDRSDAEASGIEQVGE